MEKNKANYMKYKGQSIEEIAQLAKKIFEDTTRQSLNTKRFNQLREKIESLNGLTNFYTFGGVAKLVGKTKEGEESSITVASEKDFNNHKVWLSINRETVVLDLLGPEYMPKVVLEISKPAALLTAGPIREAKFALSDGSIRK